MNEGERFLVRRFAPETDLDASYRCFSSGFHHIAWPLIDHAEPRLIKDFILMTAKAGDATFVAEAEGEVRGILVGCFPMSVGSLVREAAALSAFMLRAVFGFYRTTPLARAAMRSTILGYSRFLFHHPVTPSETLMLTSQKEFRGGIGRALMDAWVAETMARGHRRTTVCTDSALSWEFYERYGFSRVRQFPHDAYCFSLPGEDVTGYIYSLDLFNKHQ